MVVPSGALILFFASRSLFAKTSGFTEARILKILKSARYRVVSYGRCTRAWLFRMSALRGGGIRRKFSKKKNLNSPLISLHPTVGC